MPRIRYVQHDTSPPLTLEFSEADGTPADIGGCIVTLNLLRRGAVAPQSLPATITATPGRAQVPFGSGDLAVAGDYNAEVEIIFPDGGRQTIDATFLITVRPQIA